MILIAGILGQVCGSGGGQNVSDTFKVGKDINVDDVIKKLQPNQKITLQHMINSNGQPNKSGCSLTVTIGDNQSMQYESIVLDAFVAYIKSFAQSICDFIIKYSNNQYKEGLEKISIFVRRIIEVDEDNKQTILQKQNELKDLWNKLNTEQIIPKNITQIIPKLFDQGFLQSTSWESDLSIVEKELAKHKIYAEINEFWENKKTQQPEPTDEQTKMHKQKTKDLRTKLDKMPSDQKTDVIKDLIRILGYINTTQRSKSFLDWKPGEERSTSKEREDWKAFFENAVEEHEKQKKIDSILTKAQTILNRRKALRNSIFFLQGILDYLNSFSDILNRARASLGKADIRPELSKIKNTIESYINGQSAQPKEKN